MGLEVDVVYPPCDVVPVESSTSPSDLAGEPLEDSPKERPTESRRTRISSVVKNQGTVIESAG